MKKLLLSLMACALFMSCSNSINDKLPIPEYFSPDYSIISKDDIQYKSKGLDIMRYSFKVTLPKGLTESEIKYNFRKIVLDTYEKTNARNISIFAYFDQNEVNGAYTIAMYEFCPYGDWSRTDESYDTPTELYEENFRVNPSYFVEEPKIETAAVGDYVILNRERKWDSSIQKFVPASNTQVSKIKGDYNNESVRLVKNGTKAKIIDIYSRRLTPTDLFVDYEIKTSNNITGWVSMDHTVPVK